MKWTDLEPGDIIKSKEKILEYYNSKCVGKIFKIEIIEERFDAFIIKPFNEQSFLFDYRDKFEDFFNSFVDVLKNFKIRMLTSIRK